MTIELEKQFFDTFGIEKTCNNKTINPANCPINKMRRCCGCDWLDYPQITDRILLELICIWNLYCTYTLIPTNYPKIKEYVLEQFLLIDTYDFIVDLPIVKHQVQAIFEGER